jgi:hypothetical protein
VEDNRPGAVVETPTILASHRRDTHSCQLFVRAHLPEHRNHYAFICETLGEYALLLGETSDKEHKQEICLREMLSPIYARSYGIKTCAVQAQVFLGGTRGCTATQGRMLLNVHKSLR